MKNHNRLLLRFVLLCLFFTIQAPFAAALGISPGRTLVDFSPGFEKTVQLTIVNTEHKNLNVVLYAEGELAPYMIITPEQLLFTPDESEKQASYTVQLPGSFTEPGLHSARILAREVAEQTQAEETIVVQAFLAVASAFDVRVPYPGKYLKTQIYISEPREQQPVTFLVQAHNLGTEAITTASMTIEIFDDAKKSLALLTSEQQPIAAGKRVEFLQSWDPETTYNQYTARFRIVYDGKTIQEEQRFTVGQFALEPLSISVNDFTLGTVAKFNILLKNHASTPVTRATAHILLSDQEEKQIADFSSIETPIPSLAVKALFAYWDTESVPQGTYDGKLVIAADENHAERRIRATVTEKAITTEIVDITGHAIRGQIASAAVLKKESTFALLTLLVVLANSIGWYAYLKRKNKKKFMDDF
ncbi:MAG: hypothetical protein AABW64_03925 [Nanoarchaeota archaeon]